MVLARMISVGAALCVASAGAAATVTRRSVWDGLRTIQGGQWVIGRSSSLRTNRSATAGILSSNVPLQIDPRHLDAGGR